MISVVDFVWYILLVIFMLFLGNFIWGNRAGVTNKEGTEVPVREDRSVNGGNNGVGSGGDIIDDSLPDVFSGLLIPLFSSLLNEHVVFIVFIVWLFLSIACYCWSEPDDRLKLLIVVGFFFLISMIDVIMIFDKLHTNMDDGAHIYQMLLGIKEKNKFTWLCGLSVQFIMWFIEKLNMVELKVFYGMVSYLGSVFIFISIIMVAMIIVCIIFACYQKFISEEGLRMRDIFVLVVFILLLFVVVSWLVTVCGFFLPLEFFQIPPILLPTELVPLPDLDRRVESLVGDVVQEGKNGLE